MQTYEWDILKPESGSGGYDPEQVEARNHKELLQLIQENLNQGSWFDDPENGELGFIDVKESPIKIRVRFHNIDDEDEFGDVDLMDEFETDLYVEAGRKR